MNNKKTLTLLEIENLMLETLAYKEEDIDCEGKTFYKYGYQGTQADLFSLMESLAIKKNLIDEQIKIPCRAWGSGADILHSKFNTNFESNDIKKIYESFYILLNRGIIAPGAIGNYGPNLPSFHVTEYGKKCLEEKDILPYDSELYLDKLRKINNVDEWVLFYIEQALECYNNYCYESSLIMIGLANECIVEKLINNYIEYLKCNFNNECNMLKCKLEGKRSISTRYFSYKNNLKRIMKKDNKLASLSKYLDTLAIETYMTYMRLTRNELSHPNEIKIDKITALMIFISFIKYCEYQYIFINYFKENTKNK